MCVPPITGCTTDFDKTPWRRDSPNRSTESFSDTKKLENGTERHRGGEPAGQRLVRLYRF